MEKEIIEMLKERAFDFDNYEGVMAILDGKEKYLKKMRNYLIGHPQATRNDIFLYAFKITNTEFDTFEIV